MRTKSLNLKKKIAFIASVAMLASTVAYLPADFVKDIGIGNGIVADAETNVSRADGYDDTEAYAGDDTAAPNKIDTFSVLVMVNGKYLAKNAAGEYKTYTTKTAAKNDGYDLVDYAGVIGAAKDGFTDPFADNGTAVEKSKNYDLIGNTQLNIPYLSTANPTITLEFVAKKDCIKSSRSLESVEVELNDNGVGIVGKQTDYAVFQSNNSDYKESKGGAPTAGSYEVFDVSGLVIKMDTSDAVNESITGTKITKIAGVDLAEDAKIQVAKLDSDAVVVTEGSFLDEEDETPLTYEVKKFGNVYAKVMTGTLTGRLEPGTQIEVTTGAYATWSVTGATNGVVKLTMGENGYAESGLVTMTQGSKKEYYVFVFKNKDTGNEVAEGNVTLAGKVQNTPAKVSSLLAYGNDSSFRVESEVKTYSFADLGLDDTSTQERYVTEYTIYNNESSDEYESQTEEFFTIDSEIAASNTAGFSLPSALKNGEVAIVNDGTHESDGVNTKLNNVRAAANGVKFAKTVSLKKTGAGTAESAILKLTSDGKTSYVKYVFKNSYKLKYNDTNSETNENKTYDGYVEVTDGTKISAPADAVKPGFEFQGWVIGNTDVFLASEGAEQLDTKSTTVTPNKVLTAKFDGLRYNIAVHAGDGVIDTTNAANMKNFSGSNYKTYNQASGCYTDATFTSIQRESDDTDLTAQVVGAGSIGAKKYGYTFKGWALTEGATKPATLKELKAAFPGSGKTLDLYAVYEAKEDVVVSWGSFAYDNTTGAIKTITGKQTKVDAINIPQGSTNEDNWLDATVPTWNKASDSSLSVTVGQKLGTLPTPVKKGYTFDGWFAKRIDKLGNVTAVPVTANTVFDESIFNVNNASANYGEFVLSNANDVSTVELTLFAKFTPGEYTINFDLGDGTWKDVTKYDDADSDKPVSYKIINDQLKLYKADGTESELKFNYDAIIGSGDYKEFKGWKINGGSTIYQTNGLATALLNQKTAADVTITAYYQAKTNANAAISIDANGGNIYYALYKSATDSTVKGFYDNLADMLTDADASGKIDVDAGDETTSVFADNTYEDLNTTATLQATTPATAVSKDFIVNGNTVRNVANKLQGFVVSRPGYTFDKWYADKECTIPYTFDNFPAKGNEVVVYAGWKANTATKWQLQYELINADGSVYDKNDGDGLSRIFGENNPHDLSFIKTYNGTTGTVVDAADKTIQTLGDNAKTYVFDKALSEGRDLTTKDEVDAEYSAAKLQTGSFVIDSDKYTVIEGVYVEEGAQPEATLGTATNVKADNGTVTFTAAANADHYKIQKTYTTGGATKTALGGAFTGTSGSYKVPTEGSSYKIAVIAYNADESKSTVSAAVTVNISTAATVGKATNLKVDNGTVTFTAAANADHYKVQKTYTNAQGKEVTAKGSAFTGTKGTFSVPAQGDYKIAVIAYDKNETQAVVSGTVTVKAAATTTMDAVDDSTITVDTATGKVSWSAAKGAKYYKVFKIVKENGKEKTYWGSKVSDTSYTFKNLPTDDFKVYVAAISEDGNTVKYSAKVKVSLLPAATNVKISSDKKTVSWTKVTGDKADKIVKYQVAKFNPDTNTTDYSVKVDASESSITMKNAAKSGIKIFVLAFDADGNSSYSQSITVE